MRRRTSQAIRRDEEFHRYRGALLLFSRFGSLPYAFSQLCTLYDRLARPLAQVSNDAFLAERLACDTSVTSVQNKPMVRMLFVFRWHHLLQFHFDFEGRFPGRQPGAVSDANARFAETGHFFRCVCEGEKRRGRLVDTGVCCLRRKNHRDQQCEWIDMLQFALWLRICGLEATERFGDLRCCPLRQRTLRRLEVGRHALGRRFYLRAFARARFCLALRRSLSGGFSRHHFGIVSAMTPDNADDLEPTIFSATLTPHRSLGHVGFLVL